MAIRTIRVEGDEILVKKSKPIKEITPKILELIEDMKETMREENGAGLAAVQVGVLKQLFIVDVNAGEPELGEEIKIFINPEIIEMSGKVQDLEGCLSVPGQTGIITRAQKVKIRYRDENFEEQELVAEDFYAKALQHEYDHLQGILYNTKADATNLSEEEIDKFLKERE